MCSRRHRLKRVSSGKDPPKQAENENPPNHHSDDNGMMRSVKSLFFGIASFPLRAFVHQTPSPDHPRLQVRSRSKWSRSAPFDHGRTRSDDAPLQSDQTHFGTTGSEPPLRISRALRPPGLVLSRSDDAPLPDQTPLGKFAVHPEQIGNGPFPAAYNLCAWGPGGRMAKVIKDARKSVTHPSNHGWHLVAVGNHFHRRQADAV